jgi:hypothetical protein
MSENLYQLRTKALPGQAVLIDGPYDRYGRVIKLQDSGFHLIRGTGFDKPQAASLATCELGAD